MHKQHHDTLLNFQVDVNVLCKSNFDCTNNAECIENQCHCKDGFYAKGSNCEDIDECASKNSVCGVNAVCINTPGGYNCECAAGFVGTPPHVSCRAPCDDVKCGEHAYCKPDGIEAYCVCEEGWTFDPNDIAAGCIDINECDISLALVERCGKNANCTNTLGSFTCQCPEGYSGDPFKQCFDIDECQIAGACGLGADCINREGSFTCECADGTIPDPDPHVRCVEVLTCKQNNDCPGNALCDESARCLCPEPNVGNDCRRKYYYFKVSYYLTYNYLHIYFYII